MKKILFLTFSLTSFFVFSQTVFFSENMGTTSGTTTLTTTTNTFQNVSPITFSGTADFRNTSPTSTTNYASASGGRNAFFGTAGNTGKDFLISGINTSAYSSISLEFGFQGSTLSQSLAVEISTDGVNFTPLTTITAITANTWEFKSGISGIPTTTNLSIKFIKAAHTTTFRIDDVALRGTLQGGVPVLLANPINNSFSYAAGSGPSTSVLSSFTGMDLTPASGNITITAPSGYEVSNDNITFSNNFNLAYTLGTISSNYYVRLKNNLSIGVYNQDIVISGGGADNVNVALTGIVYQPFTINYSNDFRSLENRNIAILQGFVIDNVTNNASGYQVFEALGSFIETPNINFNNYQLLEIKFSTATFGGSGSQRLVAEYTIDGTNYIEIGAGMPTSSSTYVNSNFVFDFSNITAVGKIRFRFQSGTNKIRFRDIEINVPEMVKLNQTQGQINYTDSFPVSSDITILGVTNTAGQGAGISASVGMSLLDTNPNTWNETYSWKTLNYSSDNNFSDVYNGNIGPMYQNAGSDVWYWSPGVYYYATRFLEGANTYYGGVAASNIGGVWNGTTYKNGKLKILTQVRPSQDNTTYKSINLPINAVNVVNALDYTFEFKDATTNVLIAEVTSTLPVTNFAALLSNATSRTYKIRVKANIIGGETLTYGPTVTITLDLSTTLVPSQCGLVVSNHPSALFNAVPISGATNYQFEVTVNNGTPQVITTSNPFFTFGQLTSLPGNSATIGVKVKAEVEGNYADYGTSCNVFTSTQITQLNHSHCGLTLPPIASVRLNAIPVENANEYNFSVTIDGNEQVIVTPNPYVNFSELAALPGYSKTLAVKVRAKVGSIYGEYGNSCNIFTIQEPTRITQVVFSQCNMNVISHPTTKVDAFEVDGASNYEFDVTINGASQSINTAMPYFTYSQLSSLPTIGQTVSVKVRATKNGIVGEYGNTCNITVSGNEARPRFSSIENEITAFPNPFSNEFTLKLANNDEAIIQVFDINGRLIHNQIVNNTNEIFLGKEFSAGVYLINVLQNNDTKSFKMIKK